MIEPEGHLGHWAGKCYLLRGISQDLRFSSRRATVYLRRRCTLELSGISGKCWKALQSWNVCFVNEMRFLTPSWSPNLSGAIRPLNVSLWVGTHTQTHTHTHGPDVHLAWQMISNFMQFLNISLFGTAATSYGTFHYTLSKTHTFTYTHTYPFIHLFICLYLQINLCCSLFISVFKLKVEMHDGWYLM